MGYAADVKALTADISRLTAEINKMHTAVSLTSKDMMGVFQSVRQSLGGGQKNLGSVGGNIMQGSMANVPNTIQPTSMGSGNSAMSMYGQMGRIGLASSAVQALAVGVSTAYSMAPDASGVVNRAGSYYQSALRSPGLSRASLERATFSALRGGLSGVGSDAEVANILTNAGYTPGGVDYLAAARQVRGAATYLGMNNSNAAQAIAGLQGGPMSASLYQYGITTMDTNGKAKSVGSIAQQLYNVMFPGGATAKSVQESIRSGYAGLNLQGMGMSADQQQMISQAFIDIANGKNPDLASQKSSKGNQNPFDPLFRANTSSTMIQGAAEKNTISGLGAAAGTIETFNNSMKDVITSMALFKGYLDGLSGNPQGAALKKGGSQLLGIGKKALGFGMMAVGAMSSEFGVGVPLVAGGAALAFGGGGNPGFGSSFGGRNLGASKYASALISAGYGAREAQGGNWSSTGGVHKGTDFNVPTGTRVNAAKDGVVSNITLSADYGQAVIIDHEGGYSTIYAHLSNKEVSPGTRVLQGQEIGKSGKSGNASGPHLHYEVWKGNNNPVDPSELKGSSLPVMGAKSSSLTIGGGNPLQDVIQGFATQDISTVSGGSASGSPSVVKGTGDKKTWATQLLSALGAPTSDSNINALVTWQSREGGHWNNSASYNPLNTTLKTGSSHGMSANNQRVQAYGSWEEGIQATVNTLTGASASSRGYSAIVDALRSGADTGTILSAISNSAWVSGKTGSNSYNGFTGGGRPGAPGIYTPDSRSTRSSATTLTTPSSGESKIVNLNVTLTDVSEAQALIWAKKIEEHLNNRNEISAIGGK